MAFWGDINFDTASAGRSLWVHILMDVSTYRFPGLLVLKKRVRLPECPRRRDAVAGSQSWSSNITPFYLIVFSSSLGGSFVPVRARTVKK